MAAFNLTAQLNIVGPNNLRPVIADIRRQISSINTNINFTVNPAAIGSSSQLARSLQDLNRAFASVSSSASNATAAINNFSNSLQRVNLNRVNQNITQTNQSLQNLQRNQRQTSQSIGESTNAMQEFGRQSALAIRRFAAFSVVTGVIFKVTSAISSASSEFMTFNKELVRVAQVTGQSIDSLSTLERQITNLSTNLGVSSTELIKVSSTLAQAGLTAKEAEQALKALALSALAPSFDKLSDTVEGSIALMRQFSISTAQLEGALGSINAVAAKFAVEASDIITAIQRTGGVFANASKGVTEGTEALNQFIAVFTSIRATTRESAETIATGLRTIFTRIQRGKTIDALKQYGVVLTDLEGKFVGPYEAVKRLSEGLARLDPRDLRFSQIIEELGGFRQIGKVIPLIQQFTVAQQALGVAQRGSGSLAGDAAKAQQALAVQIAKVQEEFVGLVRKIGSSKEFQSMVSMALSLASALIKIAEASKHALPAITAMLAIRGTMGAVNFLGGFMGSLGGGRGRPPGRRAAYGGKIGRYADGGEIPVALMPGEAVIYPEAAAKIGTSTLRRMNYADKRQKRAGGGKIGIVPGQGNSDSFYTTLPEGSFVIRKAATEALGSSNISDIAKGRKRFALGGLASLSASSPYVKFPDTTFDKNPGEAIKENLKKQGARLRFNTKDKISANIRRRQIDINKLNLNEQDKYLYENAPNNSIRGSIFERLLDKAGLYKQERRSSFSRIDGSRLGVPVEIKSTKDQVSTSSLLNKLAGAIIYEDTATDKMVANIAAKSKLTKNPETINAGNLLVLEDKTALRKGAKTQQQIEKIEKNRDKKLASKQSIKRFFGGYIQNFAEGSDEPIAFPGRSKFLKVLNAVKASSLIGGRDARKILGMKKRSGQDEADFKTLMSAYGEAVTSPTIPAPVAATAETATLMRETIEASSAPVNTRRTVGAIALTGQPGEQIVKSAQGTKIRVQKGVIDPGTSRRFRADVRKMSRELAKKWGGIFASQAGSTPVVGKKELDRILGPGLSNITGAVFEAALASAGAPYEATLRKRPIDFPQGLGKVAALVGLPENLATEAKADLSSAALKRVATQADPSPRKKKRKRSKLKYGGFPLVDDLPNAPGSLLPMPGISPGSPLYKIIKNKGGVLDYDRTLQRTVGDSAYASAKTEEQRNAVLDRYFRDSAARLKDAKTAKLTQFGQQLQALIKKGIIDPKKLSIISKSSKTEGLPEHINRLFGIPTSNMEFTSGQSKVNLLEEIRRKGPKAYRRVKKAEGDFIEHGGIKYSSDDVAKVAAKLGIPFGQLRDEMQSRQSTGFKDYTMSRSRLNELYKLGLTAYKPPLTSLEKSLDIRSGVSGKGRKYDRMVERSRGRRYAIGGGVRDPRNTLEKYFEKSSALNAGLTKKGLLPRGGQGRKEQAARMRDMRSLESAAPAILYSSLSRKAFNIMAMQTGLNKDPNIPEGTRYNDIEKVYNESIKNITGKTFSLPGYTSTSKTFAKAKMFLDNAPRSRDNWAAMMTIMTKKSARGVDVVDQLKGRQTGKARIDRKTGKTVYQEPPESEDEFILRSGSRFRINKANFIKLGSNKNLWMDVQQFASGGSLYKNDKNKKAGYDPKKLAAFLGAAPVATDKQNKLAEMLNEGQVKKPDYEELLKKLKGYAAGGEIPILAQEGEFVINKHSARSIGYNNLKKLNRGGNLNQLPKYHSGGKVQKLKRGGVTGKSFTDTQSPLDLLQKTPSGDYVARAVKHNQTRDKAIKDIANSRAKEAQELTAAAGDAKKQAAITKTAKTERANIRKAVAADKSRAKTDPKYLTPDTEQAVPPGLGRPATTKVKLTAAEKRADMEARGVKGLHRSLDDVTTASGPGNVKDSTVGGRTDSATKAAARSAARAARRDALRTQAATDPDSLNPQQRARAQQQERQATRPRVNPRDKLAERAKAAGFSTAVGTSGTTTVTDDDINAFRASEKQKKQQSRTATSNTPILTGDSRTNLEKKVSRDRNKSTAKVGAMSPDDESIPIQLARKRAIKHEAIAGKYQAKSVSLADKASRMAGGGGSTSGIMAGLNKAMSPLVSTMSKVNAGMSKVHGGIAVFNRGLVSGGGGLKSYAASIINAKSVMGGLKAAISPVGGALLKLGKGVDNAAGRLMGMQKGSNGKWSNAPGGIMGRIGGFFGMGGGGSQPGSKFAAGRRAVAARRAGGENGGGAMGGYMGMMALDMAGSVGIEGLASIMGGEKTKEGRQVSTVGGSALAGASTGMMIGSMIPVVGTVVGGAVGAGVGALYGMSQSQQQEKEVLSQERRDKMGTGISKMNQNLSIASDTSVSDATRQKARNEALSNFRTVSAENKKEQAAGMEQTRSWAGWAMGAGKTATKTTKERQEAAQPAADAAKQFLIAEMNRTGQTLAQLEKTMPAEDFKKLSEAIAMTDAAYQDMSEASEIYAKNLKEKGPTDINNDGLINKTDIDAYNQALANNAQTLEQARRAAMERSGADLKAAEEAMKIAREQKKLQQAMQKLSTSFEKAAENMTSAVGVASTMLDRAAANIEAIDNPKALVSNASRSNNLDELNNLNAFSTSDQENILRKNAGMFGSSAESMVRSATLPRRLEEGLRAGMVGTQGKTGDEQKEAATKAISQTMESAFGPEMAGRMQGDIKKFIDKFVASGGDLSQLDIGDLMSEFPALANAAASSAKALEAIKSVAVEMQKAMNLAASAASNMAEKRQQARNNTADTYQTVGQSTIDFKRAIGEKVSFRSEAGLRTGSRAIRMGTDVATASDPKAIAARYKAQTVAAQQAAANQNKNQIELNSGQAAANGMPAMDMAGTATEFTNAATATAELANSAAQAREELMRMPDDIKSNIQGIMTELQDVLQERAAKVNAASGFMEKVLTSTPKELMTLGDTMNNVSRALSGNAVSFQESKAANMAYNKTIRAGGTHGQAQKAAQEAYSKETSDSLSMVKEIAPLIGAVNPEEQNKMMATMYESMFKARGMDPSKMQVGDKTMADYLKMMKEGAAKDPKVQALEQALAAEQAALQTATDTINQVLKDEAVTAINAARDAIVDALKEAQTIFNARQEADRQNGITPPGEMPGAPTNPVAPPPNVGQQIAQAQAAATPMNTTSAFPNDTTARFVQAATGQPVNVPTASSVAIQTATGSSQRPPQSIPAAGSPIPAPRVPAPTTPAQNNTSGVLPGVAGFDQFASKLDALLGKLANVSIPSEIRIKLDSSTISVQLTGQELLNNLQKILGESVRTEIASAISQYNNDNFQGEGRTPSSRPVGARA